ncbi:antibiotic biosynthesis monooxygenase family protein [Pseudomonas soli]|uniref:antibiotic biosynthesis monooxygenase family protein n=1 Tax=Pseudomonas soli TaxID=1306993 RepID=UPI003811CB92
MALVALNTVEIDPAKGATQALRAKLEVLLETLNRTSGCTGYTLCCREASPGSWLITGYWDSAEQMTAHFHLPCLAVLFELTSQRLVSRLCFSTFLLAPT